MAQNKKKSKAKGAKKPPVKKAGKAAKKSSATAAADGDATPAIVEAGALAALLADPPLIRRPLLDISGLRLAGWDGEMLDALIGLAPRAQPVTEACVHPAGSACSGASAS